MILSSMPPHRVLNFISIISALCSATDTSSSRTSFRRTLSMLYGLISTPSARIYRCGYSTYDCYRLSDADGILNDERENKTNRSCPLKPEVLCRKTRWSCTRPAWATRGGCLHPSRGSWTMTSAAPSCARLSRCRWVMESPKTGGQTSSSHACVLKRA
jgi:hypothetical protein